MQCGTVPPEALEFGWEADVHLFAYEHGIKIDSKKKYCEVKVLLGMLARLEALQMKKKQIDAQIAVARKRRDQLKLSLGYKRKEIEK